MRRKLTEKELRGLDGLEAELKRWQAFLEEQKAELNEFLAELLSEPNGRNNHAS